MKYHIAKAARDQLSDQTKAATAKLRSIPGISSGSCGLTPDSVKFSPEFRAAKAAFDRAFAAERKFNAWFTREFRNELRAEKNARLAALNP